MFKRTIEDFVCEKCGANVTGDGYTNHCPKCLYSKHVDISPGDRAATCGGLMEPVRIEGTVAEYRIVHRCLKCGHEMTTRTSPGDSESALIDIARRQGGGTIVA